MQQNVKDIKYIVNETMFVQLISDNIQKIFTFPIKTPCKVASVLKTSMMNSAISIKHWLVTRQLSTGTQHSSYSNSRCNG